MKLILPKQENLIDTSHDDDEDPIRYYYKPFFNYVYCKRLKMCLKSIKDKKFNNILEIGYGPGIFIPTLSKISEKVYGLDIHKMEKEISKSLERENVNCYLVSGDLLNLPYDYDLFDGIVSISTLEHIKDLDKAMNEFDKVLKHRGNLYIGVPVRNNLTRVFFEKLCRIGMSTDDMHVSSQRDVYNALKKKFKINKITTFPKFLPMNFSFYVMIEAEKI